MCHLGILYFIISGMFYVSMISKILESQLVNNFQDSLFSDLADFIWRSQ